MQPAASTEPGPNADPWSPPFNLGEKLKYTLVPPSLYIRYRTRKELRRGEQELRLLPFLADPTRTSLDIGANKGIYTYFLQQYSAHVHALEPNPKLFKVLSRMRYPNVTYHNIAASDETGTAALRVPLFGKGYSNQGSTLSSVKVTENYREVSIPARRIDDLGVEDIAFIKIDVEGFELQVLEGARETIARDRPNLLVEMEEAHTKQPINEQLDFVQSLGYRALFLHRRRLKDISLFDPEIYQRADGLAKGGDYIYNFIFLPIR